MLFIFAIAKFQPSSFRGLVNGLGFNGNGHQLDSFYDSNFAI